MFEIRESSGFRNQDRLAQMEPILEIGLISNAGCHISIPCTDLEAAQLASKTILFLTLDSSAVGSFFSSRQRTMFDFSFTSKTFGKES